jgi:DnaJ family protein C protein 3
LQLLREAEHQLKLSKRKDYYKILGLDKSADVRDIKKAYKTLAKVYHPDKQAGVADKKSAEDKFKDVAEAYEVLSDDEKRAAYDRGDDLQEGMGGGGWGPFGHPGGFHHGGQQFQFHFQM